MQKKTSAARRPRAATLPGVLARYLLLTAAVCALAALAWWYLLALLVNCGLVLPANAAEQAALAALEALPRHTAQTFAEADLDPLCRYVLFAGAGQDTVLATNLDSRALAQALRCWHGEPAGGAFYPLFSRRATLADGTVCLLVYRFSMPYAIPALRGRLPDFQVLAMLVLAALELLAVALCTRRTARRLARAAARLEDAAGQIGAGLLDGAPFGHADIRELDAALQAMQTLRGQLAASLRSQWAAEQQRSEQIAALTHDLKTPLTVISGHAELLAEDAALPPAARESAAAILRGAARAQRHLADLRAAAASGAADEAFAPLDTAAFWAERCAVGRALCAPAQLEFAAQSALPAPLCCRAQAGRLARAVDNLLDNAVRCTPPGGKVTLTASFAGGALRFAVRDTGPGFTPEALRKAGQLLYTGDAARGAHQGLGLYFARTVAEAHGGGLALQNNTPAPGAEAALWVRAEAGG